MNEQTSKEYLLVPIEGEFREKVDSIFELATQSVQRSQVIGHEQEKIGKSVEEILTGIRSVGDKQRDQQIYNVLQEVRSILSSLEENFNTFSSHLREKDRLVKDLREREESLQQDFIFHNQIEPGVWVLIGIRDNLLIRLNHIDQQNEGTNHDEKAFLQGVNEQLLKALQKFGISEIQLEAEGREVDSEYQEVAVTAPVQDQKLEGKVLEILYPGYRRESEVLRTQQVKVAKLGGEDNDG